MINPARKAPRDRESPRLEVRSAVPKQRRMMEMIKSSRLRVWTTWWRRLGTTNGHPR